MPPLVRPLAAILAAAALAFAACGDDDDERGDVRVEGGTDTAGRTGTSATTPTTTARDVPRKPVATVRVRETEFELRPQNPRIARVGVVTFRVRNAGDVMHALEVHAPTGEQETEPIRPGGSATLEVTFDRPGRFKWYCPVGDHEDRGMTGFVTVGRGRAARGDDRGGGRRSRGGDDGGGEDDDRGRNRGRGGDTGGGVSGY